MKFKKNPFGADYAKIGIGVFTVLVLFMHFTYPKETSPPALVKILFALYAFFGFSLLFFVVFICNSTILIDQDGVHEYWWRSNILHAEILWNDCAYIEVSTHYYGLQREICFSRLPLPPDGKIKKRAKDVIDMNATDDAVLNAVYAHVSPKRVNFVTRANVR